MLLSDKFYRSFVLVPCEICVVPFGHRKIAADWNDIPLAKMKSTVVGLTHACASLCSFKHGYLSLQKYSLFGRRLRGKLYCVTYKSILSQKACKHAFRHASPQSCLCVTSSFRHGGWAARPAAGHKIADGKRKKTCHMTCLFSNRQLSILPGRFQPSTFDV